MPESFLTPHVFNAVTIYYEICKYTHYTSVHIFLCFIYETFLLIPPMLVIQVILPEVKEERQAD